MFVDILPNLATPIIVYATLLVPASIALEATLSFVGLGTSPPTAEWGNMLAEAVGYYQVAWWFLSSRAWRWWPPRWPSTC